jgi:hypothetical protein
MILYSVDFTDLLRSIRKETVTTNEGKAALRKERWNWFIHLHRGHDTDNVSKRLPASVKGIYHTMVVVLSEGSESVMTLLREDESICDMLYAAVKHA